MYAGSVDKQFCVYFTADDIKIAITKLKKGQASDSDIVSEYISGTCARLYVGDVL